jgi:hypothetical protein
MLAAVDQNRSRLADAGSEAARALAGRIDEMRAALTAQAQGLFGMLDESRTRFAAASDEASGQLRGRLEEVDAALSGHSRQLFSHIDESRARMLAAGDAAGGQVQGQLAQVEEALTERSRELIAHIDEGRARLVATGDEAGEQLRARLAEVRSELTEQSRALFTQVEESQTRFSAAGARVSGQLTERLEGARQLVETISAGIGAQEAATERLVAGPQQPDRRVGRAAGRGQPALRRAIGADGDRAGEPARRHRHLAPGSGRQHAGGRRLGRPCPGDGGSARPGRHPPAQRPAAGHGRCRGARGGDARHRPGGGAAGAGAPGAAADGVERLGKRTSWSRAAANRWKRCLPALTEAWPRSTSGCVNWPEPRLRRTTPLRCWSARPGPELVETLVRVREAARSAAAHAREAISAVIPESAASLSEAARQALGDTIAPPFTTQIAELEASSQRAAAAARKASERPHPPAADARRQRGALEAKVAEERALRDEQERDACRAGSPC